MLCRRGVRLCEERSEERNTNREGMASGGVTKSFFLAYKKMSAHINHGFKKGNSSAAG